MTTPENKSAIAAEMLSKSSLIEQASALPAWLYMLGSVALFGLNTHSGEFTHSAIMAFLMIGAMLADTLSTLHCVEIIEQVEQELGIKLEVAEQSALLPDRPTAKDMLAPKALATDALLLTIGLTFPMIGVARILIKYIDTLANIQVEKKVEK